MNVIPINAITPTNIFNAIMVFNCSLKNAPAHQET